MPTPKPVNDFWQRNAAKLRKKPGKPDDQKKFPEIFYFYRSKHTPEISCCYLKQKSKHINHRRQRK